MAENETNPPEWKEHLPSTSFETKESNSSKQESARNESPPPEEQTP